MKEGLIVKEVTPRSGAFRAGLRKGDRIIAVKGEPVADELEVRFFAAQPRVSLLFFRRGVLHEATVWRRGGEPLGVTVARQPIRQCANRCVFCFVDQMPKGLRSSLYVKDEDYRYSFTNGNYVTLSRTPAADMARIVELGLSPLYVSVHATDQAIRNRLLGISTGYPIINQLRILSENAVRFHCQIVVCPGINDGAVLTRTLNDLLAFGSALLSIAVVPVGITRFRATPLTPISAADARELCRSVGRVSDAQAEKDGRRRIFCADELFIKAAMPIPPKKYYEDYPQFENGVGLIRRLLEERRALKRNRNVHTVHSCKKQRPLKSVYAVVTAVSASPFIQRIMREMELMLGNVFIRVVPVANRFFGETVTVAGLLTATDVIRTFRNADQRCRRVLLPQVMFNFEGHTLDGFSVERIEKRIRMPVRIVSTLSEVEAYVSGRKR